MKTSTLFRAALIGGVLSSAISANAVLIILDSFGQEVNISGNIVTAQETVLGQLGGYGSLSTLNYSFNDVTLMGSGVYSGTSGDLDFNFSYTSATPEVYGTSYAGVWSYSGGTGTYVNQTGGGTLSLTVQPNVSEVATITGLQGSLQAVPEPAPIVALGIGAIGLIRRRKA